MKKILILFILFREISCFGAQVQQSRLWIGIGGLASDLGRFATTASGSRSFFGPIYPELRIYGRWELDSLQFSPILFFTPIGLNSSENHSTTRWLGVGGRVVKEVLGLEVNLGLGTLTYLISGSGGTTVLNNGSSTSTFALPSRTSSTLMLYLSGGLSIPLSSRFRSDLDVYVTNLFSSARTGVNAVFSLNLGFL